MHKKFKLEEGLQQGKFSEQYFVYYHLFSLVKLKAEFLVNLIFKMHADFGPNGGKFDWTAFSK